ncbi:MAG: hypothetical protein JRG94_04960, partial [Deltaproteobacteria bacterium]|nr:hypothetical protein [Deltaproteobacteria bacterium]
MPDFSQYDTEYRPKSYFVTNPETAVISRIKGAVRRQAVRDCGVFDVDPAARAESLEPWEREAAGRLHPSLMGGEYLPNLRKDEVEIARIELDSVTGDVISLRARWASGKIR